jgi:hypothetical protein
LRLLSKRLVALGCPLVQPPLCFGQLGSALIELASQVGYDLLRIG